MGPAPPGGCGLVLKAVVLPDTPGRRERRDAGSMDMVRRLDGSGGQREGGVSLILSTAIALLVFAVAFPQAAFATPDQPPQPNATVTIRGRDLVISNTGQMEMYVDGDRFGEGQPEIWFAKSPLERGAEYRLATEKLRAWAAAKFAGHGPADVPAEIYLSGPHRDSRYRLKGYLQISFQRGVAQVAPMEFQVVNQSW